MAYTESTMLPLGTLAPDFTLPDVVSGNVMQLSDFKSNVATVIMFWCNHCPYVIHVADTVIELTKEYQEKGVKFVAISSNDVENYPEDSPEKMKALAISKDYPFAYLYDESQAVAKAYDAACTPDFYVFDATMHLVYRGQLDSSRPKNNQPLTGKDLRQALDSVIANKETPAEQRPSGGCNIKWKPIL